MPWDACLVETDTATRLLMQRALQAVLGQRAAIACASGRDQGLAVARMLPPAGRQGAMAELAIVDGELPDWGCIEILGWLHRAGARSFVSLERLDGDFLYAALRAGADGFLMKAWGIDEITHLLRQLIEDRLGLQWELAECIVHRHHLPHDGGTTQLTELERDLLVYLGKGFTLQECVALTARAHGDLQRCVRSALQRIRKA
jgi:DNA-binding NarL/FixJ family response regulator